MEKFIMKVLDCYIHDFRKANVAYFIKHGTVIILASWVVATLRVFITLEKGMDTL